MLVSHNREKLINAINYFVRETRHCHTLKLFKLLNFLDFEHFRQTGFSVTGQDYKAWPQGPAPSELWHELQNPQADLRKSVAVVVVKDDLTDKLLRRDLRAIAPFDASYFTKRELHIMKLLAEVFLDAGGETMSGFSHSKNLPWHKIFRDGKGEGQVIPYELSRGSDPIIPDMATLPDDEFKYREDIFKDLKPYL